ncbi:MAG: hypothetical protein CM1200mP18_04750 [Gammaproteobacteria bacterium]|nr:MAG: hypothetical protein CM1200mP18_04750 [Gammaproteobacteria bacterium]
MYRLSWAVPPRATAEMWQDIVLGETRTALVLYLRGIKRYRLSVHYDPGHTEGVLGSTSEFGTTSWADLLQPAIETASNG